MAWDPKEHAEEMRKSMCPVSAFYLIDSMAAVGHCHTAFAKLMGRPRRPTLGPGAFQWFRDNWYFQRVRLVYLTRRKVINYDHHFTYHWNNQEHPILLRVHSFQPRQYEVELQIPGLIADSLAEGFGKGTDEKFFCAFMSHAFYD